MELDAYSALCVELCCTSEVQVTESAGAASTAGQEIIQTVAVEPVVSDRIDGSFRRASSVRVAEATRCSGFPCEVCDSCMKAGSAETT